MDNGGMVALTGDGRTARMEMPREQFDGLLAALSMRQLATDPGSTALRPHSVAAAMLVQRIDRVGPAIADVAVAAAAERLRDIAEMSRSVRWDHA